MGREMTILSGPLWGPAAGGAPRQLVVLCHGLGADGRDLIDLAPYFGRLLPNAVFVAPDAPEPCDQAPVGRQWFSLDVLDPAKLAAGVRRGAAALDGYIDAQLARFGVGDYALLGFSQGAMTVLFAGLRHNPPPKAILAYAGALLAPEALAVEVIAKPLVLLVHGEADTVVPATLGRQAETALQAAGVEVERVFIPGLGHGMDDTGLEAGAAVLARVFGQEM